MYILKNAFRCIGRSKGRNVLIGIIVFIIALSACIGLSIRRSANEGKCVILVSHSPEVAKMCDVRYVLERKKT